MLTSTVTSVPLQVTFSAIVAGDASPVVLDCRQSAAVAAATDDEDLSDGSGRPGDALTSILMLPAFRKTTNTNTNAQHNIFGPVIVTKSSCRVHSVHLECRAAAVNL